MVFRRNIILTLFSMLVAAISIAQPEVTVKGGGFEILDGAATWPDSTGQAFGVHQANVGSQTNTFWIYNTGTSDLTLSNFRVTTVYNTQFNITTPANLIVAPGDSVSFDVEYSPIAAGTHGRITGGNGVCVAAFDTDDANEPTYDFRISGVATADPAFDCSTGRMFFSHVGGGTDLKEWNYGDQPPTLNIISNALGWNHDGMGLNTNDNYIYSMRYNGGSRNQLWAFSSTGLASFVGYVSGGGITSGMGAHAGAGAFDNNNNLYIFLNSDATSSLKKINVKSQLAETITLTDPVHIRGAIYNPDDGLLYGFSAGATHDGLVSVNPNDGTVTYIGGDGDLTYAAMFRSTDGAVYMMSSTYSMYLVDLADGSIELIGTNPGWGNGNWVDGCACGEIKAEADVNITIDDNRPSYTPGSTQTYTIAVKNNGDWGSYRDTVRNALPAGVTLMNWTSTAYGTAVSDNASGTGALEDVVDISVGDSVVYTVKVVVPPGFTGSLVNTATVTASTVVADPNMANNSSTDTDLIFSSAAEQCNNGFDDDGDGEVDCFDGDCAGTSACASHYTSGVIPECPDTPDVALFSMREQYRRASVVSNGYCTPIVGDLDGDDIPEVVVHTMNEISGGSWTNGSNATIRVLNGQNGAVKHSVNVPRIHYFTHSTSIADVDNDGDGEIYIVSGDQRLRGFDHTLTALPGFTANVIGQGGQPIWDVQKAAGVQFADFDQDGQTELFIGNQVFNALTGAILAEPPTKANVNNWPKGSPSGDDYIPSAADVLPDSFCPTCSGLEIVAGNTIYAVDLTNPTANAAITIAAQMTPIATYGDGFTSIADWDGDDSLDVIVTAYTGGASQIYIWNPRTQALVTQDQLGNAMPAGLTTVVSGRQCGRATVADFDGDGINELAIVSRNRLKLYESDLSLKWERTDFTDPSSLTSATAFDFEGDGNVEVVYRDDNQLRILDGVTGVTKDSLGCSSGTRVEMPVIADVDADGQAEIAVTCGDDLVVYEADQTPWMPTRKVWNTLSYSPVWVNDDLTIPANRQNKATIPRNDIYAAQASITDPSGALIYPALPDFVVTFDSSTTVSCEDDSTLVHVTICNEDANALLYNYPISYYDGDPNSGGTLIGTRTISVSDVTVLSTSCYSYSFNAPNQPTDLYIIANDDGTGTAGYPTTSILECDSTNNVTNGEIGCPLDAEITKDDGELSYIPGGALTYEIVAKNNGPSFTGGIVSDPLPAGISSGDVIWSATTYGGATTTASGTMNGALQDTVDIPGGDSVVYSVTIVTPANFAGDLVNVASINVVGDTITDNNTATDTDTVDCTFAIAGTVDSRNAGWTQIGTVVGGFTYNFSTAGGTKTFIPGSGPESGQLITTVVYNTGTGFSVSLSRHRYNNSNTYFSTLTNYDNTPHGWTGLSGSGYEVAPVLGFMAFVDRNGNGTYDSGTDDFIRDVNTLTINPISSGELYMAFYDDGFYTDNSGLINIDASIDPTVVNLVTSDTIICDGDSILLDAGNPGAISWLWSNGENTQTIQAQTAGEYSVVVTSAGGCEATDTMDLDLSSVTVSLGNDTAICSDSTIVLEAGNPDAVSWVWSDATATQTNSVLAGDYSVIVTDTNGCEGFDTINITQIDLIDLGMGNDTSLCAGDSLILSFNQPLGSTHLWNTGSTADSIIVNSAATYSVLVTDSNGCPHQDTLILAIDTLPDIGLGNDTTICPFTTLIIGAEGGTDWTWSTAATSQTVIAFSPGEYSVIVNDGNGCTNYDTINVSIASASSIIPNNDTTICFSDSLLLNAGNATNWNWNTGETTQTIWATEADTFWVDITHASGCSFRDSIVIDKHPEFTIELGPDTSICSDADITLNAGSAATWTWNTGETTQTINTATLGEYDVEAVNANGCIARDTITISIDTIPLIRLGNDTTICPDSSLTLTSTGGSGWTWNTTETSQNITVNTGGTIWVDVTDGNGCTNSDSIIISIASSAGINLGNDTSICMGESIMLDAGAGASWLWSTTAITQNILVTTADEYIVDVTYASGCIFSDTINVEIDTLPLVNLGNDTAICEATSLVLDAGMANSWAWDSGENSQSIIVGTTGDFGVNIIDGNGCEGGDTITISINTLPSINLGNDTTICEGESITLDAGPSLSWNWSDASSLQTLLVNDAGVYWVQIIDANSCINRDSIEVTLNSIPIVDLGGNTSVCEGSSITLDAGDYPIEIWNGSDTATTYTVNSAMTIRVEAYDAAGCSGIDEIEVTNSPVPTLAIDQADSAICDLTREETSIWVVNPEGMALEWSTGESTENITVSDTGYFVVTKTNEFNCSVTDSAFIDQYCEEKTFTMPNVFTPNGDGTNETFIPVESPVDLLEYFTFINFRVLNRWGLVVHLSNQYLPKWDGNHQGTGLSCPSGTYYWIIQYKDIYGKEKSTNGYVQLLKDE